MRSCKGEAEHFGEYNEPHTRLLYSSTETRPMSEATDDAKQFPKITI